MSTHTPAYEKQLESILGMDKSVAMDLLVEKQGISTQDINQFCLDARYSTVIKPRMVFEKDKNSLHFIPYLLVQYRDSKGFVLYQRPSKNNGEYLLAGNHSVGLGGHVDLPDILYTSNGVINIYDTLIDSAIREVSEELTFTDTLMEEDLVPSETSEFYTIKPIGFIIDSSNEVGQTHLGVFMIMEIDENIKVSAGEDQVENLQIVTLDELDVSEYNFENWSSMVVDYLKAQ